MRGRPTCPVYPAEDNKHEHVVHYTWRTFAVLLYSSIIPTVAPPRIDTHSRKPGEAHITYRRVETSTSLLFSDVNYGRQGECPS